MDSSRKRNKEKDREYNKKYYESHITPEYRARKKEMANNYYKVNKDKINAKNRLDNVRKEKRREEAKIKRLEIKNIVFNHYGRICSLCGETDERTLTIDHINGNGNKHRREEIHGHYQTIYFWLVRYNFPEGFRVLCMNCQFKHKYANRCREIFNENLQKEEINIYTKLSSKLLDNYFKNPPILVSC